MGDFIVVPVEVRCRPTEVNAADLSKVITTFIRQRNCTTYPGEIIPLHGASDLITSNIELLRVCDVYCPINGVAEGAVDYSLVMYHLHGDDEFASRDGGESLSSGLAAPCDDSDGGGGAPLPLCSTLKLPHASLEGLWESLHYGESSCDSCDLKRDLLQYMHAAIIFSMAGVDPHVIAWNQLLLFHGPPGTGKTSLCKALSQKLAIRLGEVFTHAALVEVNTQSLFSRWFSESGKQVMTLFRRIHAMAEDPNCLLCVLVDEVESLAATRNSALKGNEPSDAVRVVNTLLTQLDLLQRRRNVVILATSNITGAIDVAFIDRADKKVFIGPPGLQARLELLRRSTRELCQRGLVTLDSFGTEAGTDEQLLLRLGVVARRCESLSGRTLKKLPFLAYSRHVCGTGGACVAGVSAARNIPFDTYINSLTEVLQEELSVRDAMTLR